MRHSRVSRLEGFCVALFLLAGLAFLQVLNAEKDLVFCLPAYGAIAIATLLGITTLRPTATADLFCLCTSYAFVGYIVIRALTSPVIYVARPDLYSALAALALYGFTASALTSAGRRIALLVALLAFAVSHVLVSLVQTGLGENYSMLIPSLETVEPSARASGLYVNPDNLAGLLEVLGILGLSITCWSRWRKWAKVCVAYLTAICYLGLILTGSRGGYLSTAVSLILFAFFSLMAVRPAGRPLLLKWGGVGLVLLAALIAVAWLLIQQSPTLTARAKNTFTVDVGRLDLWRAALEQWKLQPLVGTGSGTYLFYGRQFRSERMQADPVDVHNDYLHLLCEYGLIGAAGFLVFFYAHLRHGWRSFALLGPRRIAGGSSLLSDRLALNLGALGALGAYTVHSALDFNLHIPANALLLAFVFGLIANPGLAHPSQAPSPVLLPRMAVLLLAALLLFQVARLLPGEYFAERARRALLDEDPASTVSFAGEALFHERQNPFIFFLLGRALVSLGNDPERAAERASLQGRALVAFDQARQLAPLDGSYPLELAFLYDRMGRFDEAERMYGIARARDPKSHTVEALYQDHLEKRQRPGPLPSP